MTLSVQAAIESRANDIEVGGSELSEALVVIESRRGFVRGIKQATGSNGRWIIQCHWSQNETGELGLHTSSPAHEHEQHVTDEEQLQ